MPRSRKPARLYYRADTDTWIIRDGGRDCSTGLRGPGARQEAEQALARYLIERGITPGSPGEVTIGPLLAFYLHDREGQVADIERLENAVLALSRFWSSRKPSEVKDETCRRYLAERGVSPATVRRELNVLRAALTLAAKHGRISSAPAVWLPPTSEPRPDWLTRDEFARLFRELWRHKKTRHAARLALAQFYTGSRPRTVAQTTWHRRTDGPWVDLSAGIWWRKGDDEKATKKARRPHRIPDRLLSHLRRWKRVYGGTYIAETARHPGQPVLDIGSSLATAARKAGLKQRVTPHTLKHTAITLFIQRGGSIEHAAEYFSTSIETIQRTYWHHSPHHQAVAAAQMNDLGRAQKPHRNAGKSGEMTGTTAAE